MTVRTARSPRLRLATALIVSVLCHGMGHDLYAQQRPAPSVERIVTLPNLAGTAPTAPVWSPDSRRVAFLWNDHGMPFRDLWVAAVDSGEPVRLTSLAPDPADVLGPGEDLSLDALTERAARREAGGVSQAVWDPSGEQLLFVHRGEVHAVSADGGSPAAVLRGASRLQFSPDGLHLAFLRGGDLWVRHQADGREEQLTRLGAPGIGRVPIGAYVRPDAYIADYAWAPDGRAIAFQYVDQREVRRVPFPSYLHDEPLLHEVRRPYPGDTDLIREVGVVLLESGDGGGGGGGGGAAPWFIDFPEPVSNRRVVQEISWAPDGQAFLVMLGADVAEDRWIYTVSRQGTEVQRVWHDHRPRRIYPTFRALWSGDGKRILFVGDHEDWYRVYTIPSRGGTPTRLTGGYDVAGSSGAAWMDRRGKELFFVAAAPSPYERHVFRMADAGSEPEQLTRLPGVHAPTLSPDGRWLALLTSGDTSPSELYLLEVGRGEERQVTRSPLPEFHEYHWLAPRYVTFPSRIDGFTLHARILEPPAMEPGRRYPVILGSVYSNTVRRSWHPDRPTSILQQQMAMAGDYITVLVDVRGSAGYGVAFREAFQGDWGGDDLEDLHSAVEYLATVPSVDPDRIGIWGNSYGGLLVLSALFRKPGLFAAGVAGAPAVDVAHFTGFDQHLTRRPDTHPHIFERTLLTLGEDLVDPLLVLHGVHDDIVPLKTTLMMTEKLILLGRPFELEIVHNSPHWWAASEHYARHTFRRLNDFFRRHIPPGPR